MYNSFLSILTIVLEQGISPPTLTYKFIHKRLFLLSISDLGLAQSKLSISRNVTLEINLLVFITGNKDYWVT